VNGYRYATSDDCDICGALPDSQYYSRKRQFMNVVLWHWLPVWIAFGIVAFSRNCG
jgi:hypothetical protein